MNPGDRLGVASKRTGRIIDQLNSIHIHNLISIDYTEIYTGIQIKNFKDQVEF